MISEIDLMMKCDLCLDRTSVGGKPMCASVCPSDALWYGTPDEFAATRSGRLGSALRLRQPGVTTKVQVVLDEPGPLDVLAGRLAPPQWLDDPFGLEEPVERRGAGQHAGRTRSGRRPHAAGAGPGWRATATASTWDCRCGDATSRYTAEGEDEVTRREFVRYLMLGSGAFAAGTVAVAALTSARGEPDGGSGRDRRPSTACRSRSPTSSATRPTDDPAILLLRPDGELAAYSQKCTHLGCVVFLDDEADELVCPCHEGGFSAATGDVLFGPPELPLPRITLEVRDGTVWAIGIDHG